MKSVSRTLLFSTLILCASTLFAQTAVSVLIEPVAAASLPNPVLVLPSLPTNAVSLSELWTVDSIGSVNILSFEPLADLAQAAATDAVTAASEWDESEEDMPIPPGLLNNEHYKESLRLKALALKAFEYGDYDASANYAADSARAAERSDEYVARALRMKAADDAIAAAKARLDWAKSVGGDKTYAKQYAAGNEAYNEAVAARSAEDWSTAIAAARRALALLAEVKDLAPLPAQYKVRTWAEVRDCFWNIAGYPWVYADPTKWPKLYEANRSKLRRPDNPNLLHPGIVLDIPSIYGEVREGIWVKGRAYAPLPPKRK